MNQWGKQKMKSNGASKNKNFEIILCPFHDEKTPSLKVSNAGYYCFSCGKSGDISQLKDYINDKKR